MLTPRVPTQSFCESLGPTLSMAFLSPPLTCGFASRNQESQRGDCTGSERREADVERDWRRRELLVRSKGGETDEAKGLESPWVAAAGVGTRDDLSLRSSTMLLRPVKFEPRVGFFGCSAAAASRRTTVLGRNKDAMTTRRPRKVLIVVAGGELGTLRRRQRSNASFLYRPEYPAIGRSLP